MIALIDADTMLYRAAFMNERRIYFGDNLNGSDGESASITDISKARSKVSKDISKIERQLGEKFDEVTVVLVFTGKHNWRRSVLPSYKANRRGKERVHLSLMTPLLEWAYEKYDTVTVDGLEADDVVSLFATKSPSQAIVVSIDKDLDQIPGRHYNPDSETFYRIMPAQADKLFYRQAYAGDPTDGYPGCPGIGPGRAMALIEKLWPDEEAIWQGIVAGYAAKGLDEDYAISQARVARLLRHGEYDWDTEEIHLWNPPV